MRTWTADKAADKHIPLKMMTVTTNRNRRRAFQLYATTTTPSATSSAEDKDDDNENLENLLLENTSSSFQDDISAMLDMDVEQKQGNIYHENVKNPSFSSKGGEGEDAITNEDTFNYNDDDNKQKSKQQQEAKTSSSSTTTSSSSLSEAVVGIGGKGGLVYDVNRLKRNLVQEAVREYKRELLTLLGTTPMRPKPTKKGVSTDYTTQTERPSLLVDTAAATTTSKKKNNNSDAIEEKLAALTQTNPVSTTTDSNLLDGMWHFAYASKDNAMSVLDPKRFELIRRRRRGRSRHDRHQRGENNKDKDSNTLAESTTKTKSRNNNNNSNNNKSGKIEGLFRDSTRFINLENLHQDENAHVIDTTNYLGGLVSYEKRHVVTGLTRTRLELDMVRSRLIVCGKVIIPLMRDASTNLVGQKKKKKQKKNDNGDATNHTRKQRQGKTTEIQFLYLDSDLCISTAGRDLRNPVHVYTKNEIWVGRGARIRRKLRFILETFQWVVSKLQSPFKLRRRIRAALGGTTFDADDDNDDTLSSRRLDMGNDIPMVEEEENQILLRRQYNDDIKSKLTVLKLGEVDEGGKIREDPAWEGEEDPFVHLSADERQRVLRGMSIEEIVKLGQEQKRRSELERKSMYRSQKQFKRPSGSG